MKRIIILALLATVAAMGTLSTADARGGGGRGFSGGGHGGAFRHRSFGYRYYAPVYPVYGYCRWYRTAYGLVKRCA